MSTKSDFLGALKAKFQDPERPFAVESLADSQLFIVEIAKVIINENGFSRQVKIPALFAQKPTNRCFQIQNTQKEEVSHIAIDGDFIIYGQPYDFSENPKDGRPDSLVITENALLFVELKLEQEDATFGKEDVKWKKFFEAVSQIEDFITFLKSNEFEPKDFYPSGIKAVVCMRFEPKFQSSTKRNQELFKRSTVLGFEIIAHNCEEEYIL